MNTSKPPSYEELKRRLEAAESALKAIREGRVDTILGESETLVVRLAEAEAREAHLKQVLLAIRNVNQLIVAEDDPQRLIERACVNLTETMGYHNAWIALLGGESARGLGLPETRPVAAAAAAGFDGGFEILRERLARGEFPDCMARALESKEVLVVGDPAADCPDCPLHGQYGGRAGLVRRLEFDGVTYGILTASVPAAYARDAEEQDLFNEVAGDLAFALYKITTTRKLENSRRYLGLVIEGSGVGTWEWNVQTNETLFNEQWAAMLGYTIEELTPYDYATWERLVHSDDLEQARRALLDCVEGRTTDYNCEFRMKHKDGSWVWILDRGRVMIRDDAGKALSMFGTHTDITDLKQTEEALNREHMMLARTEAVAHVGSWEWQAEGDKVTWSEELFRIFGLEPREEAPPFAEHQAFYVPEDRARLVKAVDECLRNGVPYDLEVHLTRSDGQLRHCVVRGIPERGADGSVKRLYGSLHDITEMRRAEERISLLGRMIDEAPSSITIHDTGGSFLYANRKTYLLHGYDKDEFLKINLHELDVPESEALLAQRFRKIAEEGEARFEVAHYRKDGSTFPLEVLAKQIQWEGRPAILSIATDITESKLVELALRESEQMMRYIIKHDPNALAVYDTDLRYIAVSDRYLKDYGVAEADIIGKHHYEVFPEMPERWKEVHRRVLAGATERNDDDSFVRSDGSITYNRWECRPWHRSDGSIAGMITYTEVTTERKMAELALEEALLRQREAVKAGNVGLWDWDIKTDTVWYSPEWKRQIGYEEDEISDGFDEWKSRVHPDDLPDTLGRIKQNILDRTGAYRVEFRFRHRDGSYRWILAQATVLTDETGEPVRTLGSHIDITERKQAEAALRESESRIRRKLNSLLDPEGDIGTLHLADILDCDEIRSLMNDFNAFTEFSAGIHDLDDNILVGTGWQDLCTNFHRVHPETEKLCRESDTMLASGVEPGTFKIYKCKNNLWKMVTPIMIGGKHIGNLFLGQFFFEGEAPDIATFREQARRYGFDEDAYLEAYRAIPRWSRETVDRVMTFYCNLINVISRLSYAQIKLARMTEALRKSEGKFRALAENTIDWIWQTDANGKYTYVSENSHKIMGYASEELLGRTPFDFMDNKEADRVRSIFQEIVQKHDRIFALEDTLLHKDGHPVVFETNATPLIDQNGDLVGFFGTCRDITERKRAEEELRRQQRFLDLYNKIASIFLTSPRDEVFADVLDVILQRLDSRFGYFGYIDERGDLVCPSMTRDVWDKCQVAEKSIVFPRAGWVGLWGRSLMEKRTLVANNNLHFPEGHVALENALATPIVHRDTLIGQLVLANKPAGYDKEDRDILEAAAAYSAPILFAILEEDRQKSTHEKLEAQLHQAQKMEAVGRLAGGVAHDFNNMLGIIIGHADMILEEMDQNQTFYDGITAIRKAGECSADLTRQLLAFARKQTVAPKVIDLNITVEGMLKMLHRLIGENIDIAWIPGEDVWPIKIDPGQVDQILANLCVNARDAITDVGKVTIETGNSVFDKDYCKDHAEFAPGEYAMLTVSDNGCGMDPETLSHVFEPFFTTKEQGKGTGLGLATVYGVVKQNNGLINVYSEPGQGTTFKIYLPRHSAKAVRFKEKSQNKPSERGQEIILLVEDDQALLGLTKRMLERDGYTVLAAGTPGEAIRLANEHAGDIHLLMSDVVMPEMNGRDLAKNILSLYPQVKCLFMSGYTANVIAHQGVLDEGVNFLQKPFSKGDLALKVREVLDKASGEN